MDLNQDIVNLIIGLSILVGALQCFFGYRIFKFILGLTGFLIGGVLAGAMGYSFAQEKAFALLAGLAGGFIGATLMVMLYYVGIFLIGALLGGFLGTVLYAVAESNPEPAVLLILAVITGVIALISQKLMIIVSTGFGGAWLVVIGIASLTTEIVDLSNFDQIFSSGGSYLYAIILCWLTLGIVGVIVQYRSEPKKKPQPSFAPNSEEAAGPYLH
ncbi:protein of unknown function (DUF4203) [Fodinibius salinus]|uniref:TM7S3/TM198-like domain-containing protein n=1 Tax=Fodinibius salinus TaxID=860790 RepID=A0A5D3YQZ9_9BACT|nr:DUF4203 domain-containing protein [Fodinibius salinus]TYP95433.1 protein of unknown function (DUF4203) [Fodinibius salinus]